MIGRLYSLSVVSVSDTSSGSPLLLDLDFVEGSPSSYDNATPVGLLLQTRCIPQRVPATMFALL